MANHSLNFGTTCSWRWWEGLFSSACLYLNLSDTFLWDIIAASGGPYMCLKCGAEGGTVSGIVCIYIHPVMSKLVGLKCPVSSVTQSVSRSGQKMTFLS